MAIQFKEIEVEIEGMSDLLMNSPKSMMEQKDISEGNKPKKIKYISEEEAEKRAYRTKKGELYIPNYCVKACILNASAGYKFGKKKSAKPIIAGNSKIEPEEIIIVDKKGRPMKKYDIDERTVVLQGRGNPRVVRARPRIKDWKAKFRIIYNTVIIDDPKIFFAILEEAGVRTGIGDWRPQKYGEFGTFNVSKFLPKK